MTGPATGPATSARRAGPSVGGRPTRPPRLLLLNGPPGIGKSTIARRYVADHPLTLNADSDAVRRLIGGWLDVPVDAGLLARRLALAMAETHLRGGHDVVLAQYLGRPEFLQEAEDVATACGAGFFEFVLMENRDVALKRFAARTGVNADQADREAALLVERVGGEDALGLMYDRLLLVLTSRPRARLIGAPDGQQDAVYAAIRAIVDGPEVA